MRTLPTEDASGQGMPTPAAEAPATAPKAFPNAAEIRDWLLHYLSELMHLPASEISTSDPLAEYGLDSSGAVGLAGDVGRWLGIKLDADLVYHFPTIDALATHLAAKGKRA